MARKKTQIPTTRLQPKTLENRVEEVVVESKLPHARIYAAQSRGQSLIDVAGD